MLWSSVFRIQTFRSPTGAMSKSTQRTRASLVWLDAIGFWGHLGFLLLEGSLGISLFQISHAALSVWSWWLRSPETQMLGCISNTLVVKMCFEVNPDYESQLDHLETDSYRQRLINWTSLRWIFNIIVDMFTTFVVFVFYQSPPLLAPLFSVWLSLGLFEYFQTPFFCYWF